MKVIYFFNEDWEKTYAEERLVGHEIVFLKGTVSDHADFRDDRAEVLSAFVNSPLGKSEIERFPGLKHIAARSTGYDHIDRVFARDKNISISSVPAYGENTVAEFAFGLLLTVSRKLYECVKKVQDEGLFSQGGLRGFDLKGKKIGILGTGRIGAHMIRIAKGFGMEVIAFDVYPNEALARELGFSYVSQDTVFAESDVVSFHLPYTKETHHILNINNIQNMKKGSVVINTARGGLIETEALVQGLRQGILSGVGLDVLEEEGYIEDETKLLFMPHPSEGSLKTTLANHYLIEHPNAIITPHNAFNTHEAVRRILDTTVENIKAFASGEAKNIVLPPSI